MGWGGGGGGGAVALVPVNKVNQFCISTVKFTTEYRERERERERTISVMNFKLYNAYMSSPFTTYLPNKI